MATFHAIPYFMTPEFFRENGGYGPTGNSTNYEQRADLTVEADSYNGAAERVWCIYQNIDANHLTPDQGRSMMVGDLVLLHTGNDDPKLLKAVMCGFDETNFARESVDG